MTDLKNCLYCAGKLGEARYRNISDRLGHVPGSWDLLECSSCKSLILSPFPSPKETLLFYPKNYNIPSGKHASGARKIASMVELCLFKLILKSDINHTQKKILKNIQHRPKILEVGCGNGSRLELFSKLNAEVIGVDMSQEDIATAKAKGLNAFCADVNDLEKYFEPNSFDIVMSFDVLEHIPNLGEFFKKLSQLLKPGGWMMAGMPSSDCFAIRILGKRWAALSEVPRHVSIPSLGGTRCLFERADLRELDYFPYGSLSCSLVLGLSLFPGGSANHFYSSGFSVLRWCQRILGGLMMFLTVPLFWGENHLTKHSSRFVMIGRKELEVKPEGC